MSKPVGWYLSPLALFGWGLAATGLFFRNEALVIVAVIALVAAYSQGARR